MNSKIDTMDLTGALTSAAQTATQAPSIHNSQPWRWRIHDRSAELYADLRRHLRANDPEQHMLMVSCGAALHHAEVALAAKGLVIETTLLPDRSDASYLARLDVTGTAEVTHAAVKRLGTIGLRHTDRRPLMEERLPDGVLTTLRSAAGRFGVGFDVLSREQVIELAAATSRAQRDQLQDEAAKAELDAWSGRGRPPFAGVPDINIPARAPHTTVPARDFGHVGTLEIANTHDNAATYAVLYGMDDEPMSWLRAGQALSALWLTAIEEGASVMPLSSAVEQPHTRVMLREILSGLGYPYIAMRLGIADPSQTGPQPTPRLKPEAIIEIVSDSL